MFLGLWYKDSLVRWLIIILIVFFMVNEIVLINMFIIIEVYIINKLIMYKIDVLLKKICLKINMFSFFRKWGVMFYIILIIYFFVYKLCFYYVLSWK